MSFNYNINYNIDGYQEPCTWHEAHYLDNNSYRMKYDDYDAYFKVFDKVFGDRDELHPGEFEQSKEYFNRLYKKLFDNSFYPATYNIEIGMVEYPKAPNIFYFYNNV